MIEKSWINIFSLSDKKNPQKTKKQTKKKNKKRTMEHEDDSDTNHSQDPWKSQTTWKMDREK